MKLKTVQIDIREMEGFISGAIASVSIWPFETIRAQRQVLPKNSSLGICAKNIYTKQGIPGFYKGVSWGTVGMAAFYGLYFTSYDFLRDKYVMNPFFASYLAAGLSCTFNNGFYVLRTRYQTQLIKNANQKINIVNVLRKEGLRGWTQGLGLTWAKNIELGGIAVFRELMKDKYGFSSVFSTFTAKIIFGLLTYPLDTARVLKRCETNPKSLRDIFLGFYRNPKSAYHGCGIYLLRSVPSTVIAFTVRDYLKVFNG